MLRYIILTLFCLNAFSVNGKSDGSEAAPDSAQAQHPTRSGKTGEKAFMFGLGYTNQYDSYLSPIEYTGGELSIMHQKERLLKRNENVLFESLLDVQFYDATSKASSTDYIGGDIHYDAGWYRVWRNVLFPRLSLKAGGQIGGTLGGLFCTRGGNNPAQAHLQVRLSASVGARYVIPTRHSRLTLSYQADIPMIGAAFTPDYGQSYYEIFEHTGYERNIRPTHPGNAFTIRQLLTVDIKLKKSSLRVGYQADIRQAKLNGLRQHQYAHNFMIGWVKTL